MRFVKTLWGKLSAVMLALFVMFGALSVVTGLMATRLFLAEVNQKVGMPLAERVASERVLVRRGRVNEPVVKELFASVMAINPMTEMYLLDPEGRILAFSADAAEVKRTQVSLEPLRKVLGGEALPIVGDDPRDESRRKVFSVAKLPSGSGAANAPIEGYLYIILGGEHFDSIVQMLIGSQIVRWGAWAAAVSLLFSSLAGVLAFRLLTRPLRRLALAMRQFQAADFQVGIRTVRQRRIPDEIDHLASTFDTMSAQMATYVDRLKRVDAHRREFVANVSHDLRTPLSAVQGYLDTLLIKGDALDAGERERYTTLALEQSQRVDRLVSELLELASLESGEAILTVEAFSTCDLVQDVVQKFQHQATARGVTCEGRFETNLPLATGDIRLVERLLDNLIDNAVRHTPPGGHVRVSCDLCDGRIEIRVEDTGPGIVPDETSKIFERFYRGRGGAESEGVGLGLAIGRRIAELHGSTLSVSSPSGSGASFMFTLPVAAVG